MPQVPENQHEYQGTAAERYDDLRTGDPKWQREQDVVKHYLHAVADANSTVLDVPVGTGRFLPLYAELGCTVVGVDASEDMLTEARRVAASEHALHGGDVTNLDLEDASVDVAVCVRLLNLMDLAVVQRALGELTRVTRSHLIMGMRTRPDGWTLRRAARVIRGRMRGSTEKLTVHTASELDRLLDEVGGEVVERSIVAEAADRSSSYHLYLIALPGSG